MKKSIIPFLLLLGFSMPSFAAQVITDACGELTYTKGDYVTVPKNLPDEPDGPTVAGMYFKGSTDQLPNAAIWMRMNSVELSQSDNPDLGPIYANKGAKSYFNSKNVVVSYTDNQQETFQADALVLWSDNPNKQNWSSGFDQKLYFCIENLTVSQDTPIKKIDFRDVYMTSQDNPVCGNGVIEKPGESCDDGNNIDGDGCQANCQLSHCPDGIKDPDEECDDNNTEYNDGCSPECKIEKCGDSIVQLNEDCDDGNTENGDGCDSQCKKEATCGDGVQDNGEECDDGNLINNDKCTNECKLQVCGDGIFNPQTEQCDDGNNENGDGCDSECKNEQKPIDTTPPDNSYDGTPTTGNDNETTVSPGVGEPTDSTTGSPSNGGGCSLNTSAMGSLGYFMILGFLGMTAYFGRKR